LLRKDWQTFFAGVEDFRLDMRKKHELIDILTIALCAIVSGADDFEEIEAYGKRKESFLKGFRDCIINCVKITKGKKN